jgi:hypothetical protein
MDPIDPKEVKRREDLNAMALAILRQARVDLDSATPVEMAVISFFVFGMILAHAREDSLEEPAIFAISLLIFMDSLGQSLPDATSNARLYFGCECRSFPPHWKCCYIRWN